MLFMKEFLKKVDFEKKNQQTKKKHAKLPCSQSKIMLNRIIFIMYEFLEKNRGNAA